MIKLSSKTPAVMCPGCDQPMTPVEYKRIVFADGLVDVTYRCGTCQMTTIRTVRSDEKLA